MIFALLLQAAPPDLDALAAAASAARKKFETEAVGWTAVHTLENGGGFEVVCQRHGGRRDVRIKSGDRELGRLVVRDGLWHVLDPLGPRQHRPYEAAFALPAWYYYMAASEPVFLEDPDVLRGLPFDGVAGGIATWRQPIPDDKRRQVELAMESVKNPDLLRQLRERIEKGVEFRVRLRDGLKVDVRSVKLCTAFTFHEKPDPKAFDLPAADWKDFSDDPTKGKLENLVMLAHSAAWQKGTKAGDMNLGLMDVETARFRRVPFEGASFLPGAFSPDRKKVYGTGDLEALVEIDLSTGANRPLAAGLMTFPAVSPDGRRVAALHMEKILESRVALIDVQSGDVKHIGAPADRAFLSWLPDGLLLLEREWTSPKESTPWICRMDLEGKTTRLRRGNQPAPLGTSILYENGGTWWTCDLSGQNEKAFGDGRRNCVLPCPSPDGKRVLMLRRRANDGPEPLLLDVATGRERVLPRADGLWGQPAWR